MVSSKDSRQSAQRTGTVSAGSPAHPAGSPAHPAGRTALLTLARLHGRQAAKEMVAVRRIGMGDDQGPSSEDGGPADV